MKLSGSCHCGQVTITLEQAPEQYTSCNCSLCRRYAAQWVYGQVQFSVVKGQSQIEGYSWGDQMIEFCFCKNCGCLTHYVGNPEHPEYENLPTARFALNARICDPMAVEHFRERKFDGADSWRYL